MKKIYSFMIAASMLCIMMTSCEPQLDEKIALGELPTSATFEISPLEEPNTFLLRSTTDGAFIHTWSLETLGAMTGREIEVTYPSAGSYDVQLTIVTDGGSATSEIQSIEVTEDLPFDCETSFEYRLLTDCAQRSWNLVDEAGAIWIGPNAGTTWFQTTEDDISERPCSWNDEWIFSEDNALVYDTKGDIWAEDYMGFNFECVDEDLLSDEIRPWASGTHTFSVDTDGDIPKLKLVGLGAYIGLPKAANGMEVGFPVSSVTYDITAIEQQEDRYYLELQVKVGEGSWRFRLESEL